MSDPQTVVHAFLHINELLVVGRGRWGGRAMRIMGAGAVTAVITHVARGTVGHTLEHDTLG